MLSTLKSAALGALRIAKTVWQVPAVKSVALTWLIRLGLSASGAAIVIPVVDALVQ